MDLQKNVIYRYILLCSCYSLIIVIKVLYFLSMTKKDQCLINFLGELLATEFQKQCILFVSKFIFDLKRRSILAENGLYLIVVALFEASMASLNQSSFLTPKGDCSRQKLEFIFNITKAHPQNVLILIDFSNNDDCNLKIANRNLLVYNMNKEPIRILLEPNDLRENRMYFIFIDKYDTFEAFRKIREVIPFYKSRDPTIIVKNDLNETEFQHFYKTYVSRHWNVNTYFHTCKGGLLGFNIFKNEKIAINFPKYDFPEICKDLNRHFVKVGMFANVAAEPDGKGGYWRRDAEIGKIAVTALNGKTKYVAPTDGFDYGNANETHINGVLKMLKDLEVQAAFNTRLIMYQYTKMVDFTYPHDRDYSIVIIYIPVAKQKQIYEIIPWSIMLLVLGFLMAFGVYLRVSDKTISLSSIFLHMVLICSSQGVKEYKLKFYKIFLATILILVFYVSNSFTAQLTSVYSVPEPSHRIKSLEELVDTDITLKTWTDFELILLLAAEGQLKKKLSNKLKIINYHVMEENIQQCKTEAYVITGKIAFQFLMHSVTEQKRVCYYMLNPPDNRIFLTYSFATNFGSPLTPLISEIVQRIVESGIQLYWEFRYDKDFRISDVSDNHPKKINMKGLYFLFAVYTGGMLIAIVVFIFEVCFAKKKSHYQMNTLTKKRNIHL